MVETRFATVDDIEKLIRCYIEIWQSLSEWLPNSFIDPELESIRKPEGRERFKQRIESKDAIFLLTEEADETMGVALGREYGGVCNLGFLGVKKEHRRKGVRTNLPDKFVEEARKRKAHKISLHTAPSLLPAIKLYIRNGFIRESFLRKHTRGLDMIVYSKFLK
jgi:ribosomal protein S18 acetylase RimI-like enzyme